MMCYKLVYNAKLNVDEINYSKFILQANTKMADTKITRAIHSSSKNKISTKVVEQFRLPVCGVGCMYIIKNMCHMHDALH